MNINIKTEGTEPSAAEALSHSALARRHMLLKGVGKGSAVLVATMPLQTLAGQSLLTFDGQHQCSVSGQHSGVHSATTTTLTCGGYSPSWWGQKDTNGKPKNWPEPLPNGWTYKTKCNDVFLGCTLRNTDTGNSVPSLWQIMEPKESSGKFTDTDEFHWVCAWLNAIRKAFAFPYTPQQVIDYYVLGTASPGYQDALLFFKTYMESHTG